MKSRQSQRQNLNREDPIRRKEATSAGNHTFLKGGKGESPEQTDLPGEWTLPGQPNWLGKRTGGRKERRPCSESSLGRQKEKKTQTEAVRKKTAERSFVWVKEE